MEHPVVIRDVVPIFTVRRSIAKLFVVITRHVRYVKNTNIVPRIFVFH